MRKYVWIAFPWVFLVLWNGCGEREEIYASVSVSTATGWYIYIYPDGSAKFGFGNDFGLRVPAGHFNFEEVVQSLVPTLTPERGHQDDTAVFLRRGTERTLYAQYTADKQAITLLFTRAIQAMPSDRYTDIWKREPPVPGSPATWPSTLEP